MCVCVCVCGRFGGILKSVQPVPNLSALNQLVKNLKFYTLHTNINFFYFGLLSLGGGAHCGAVGLSTALQA